MFEIMSGYKKILIIASILLLISSIVFGLFMSKTILYLSHDRFEIDGKPVKVYNFDMRYLIVTEYNQSYRAYILDMNKKEIGIPSFRYYLPIFCNFAIFDRSILDGYPRIGAYTIKVLTTNDEIQIIPGAPFVKEYIADNVCVKESLIKWKKLIWKKVE